MKSSSIAWRRIILEDKNISNVCSCKCSRIFLLCYNAISPATHYLVDDNDHCQTSPLSYTLPYIISPRFRSDHPVPAGCNRSERCEEGGWFHSPSGGLPSRQGGQLPNSNHVSTVKKV